MHAVRSLSVLAAATTAALIAGFFYAYAASVNRGLGRLSDADYVAAMQSINDTVRNPVFALSFFGALLALPAAAALHARVDPPRARWLTAAAILYVVGGFGVTFAFNVPLNDELAALDLASASATEIATARADYEDSWNAWNAVRTVASTLAVVCVAGAAMAGRAGYDARCSSRACGGSSMPSRAGTASAVSGSPSR
jgi:uncharacterized membrane protein